MRRSRRRSARRAGPSCGRDRCAAGGPANVHGDDWPAWAPADPSTSTVSRSSDESGCRASRPSEPSSLPHRASSCHGQPAPGSSYAVRKRSSVAASGTCRRAGTSVAREAISCMVTWPPRRGCRAWWARGWSSRKSTATAVCSHLLRLTGPVRLCRSPPPTRRSVTINVAGPRRFAVPRACRTRRARPEFRDDQASIELRRVRARPAAQAMTREPHRPRRARSRRALRPAGALRSPNHESWRGALRTSREQVSCMVTGPPPRQVGEAAGAW